MRTVKGGFRCEGPNTKSVADASFPAPEKERAPPEQKFF